jgi:type II secretory pathway pseudopilin PulG
MKRYLVRLSVRRSAFTLIELLSTTLIIAVLLGLFAPAVVKTRDAAYQKHARDTLSQLNSALHGFFHNEGEFPLSWSDPYHVPTNWSDADVFLRFAQNEINLDPELINKLRLPEFRQPPETIAEAALFPYYILSVRPGKPFERSTWDYRIAAGLGMNPKGLQPPAGNSVFDAGFIINPDGTIEVCEIYSTHAHVYHEDGSESDWVWDPAAAQGPVPPHVPIVRLQIALATVRSAEIVAPLLQKHPEAIPLIRAYVNDPANVARTVSQYDPGWFAPFADILGISNVDEVPAIDIDDLDSDPGFLFSYDCLRVLCSVYCSDPAVANSLCAKMEEAHVAELAGQINAKKTLIKNFQNQVRGQAGKSLTQERVTTLLIMSGTL